MAGGVGLAAAPEQRRGRLAGGLGLESRERTEGGERELGLGQTERVI